MQRNHPHTIYSGASSEQIREDLEPLVDFQPDGMSLETLNELIERRLIPHLVNYDHPAFHSLYNSFPEEGAKFGAEIALKYNQGVTNWQVSPGAVMLEEICCKALCQLFSLSPNSDATFFYCGTYANQSALYLALHWTAEKVGFDFGKKGLQGFEDPTKLAVITSSDAHFSLKHALRMMGLGEDSFVTIPVDTNRRVNVSLMEETLCKLKKEKEVFCVIATAGTTSTGSVDPISPIADLCKDQEIWLHVDAAYGLAYSLIPDRKPLFEGIDQADSITWDPHKQFGVPIPSSLLFVKRSEDLYRNAIYSDYFNREGDLEPNPGLKSPPTTRPFSALPVVTNIRHHGLNRIIQRLQRHIQVTQKAAFTLKYQSDVETFHEPDLGILCVRVIPKNLPEEKLDQLQQYIYDKVKSEGKRSISLTTLDEKKVLRFVVLNSTVTVESIMETLASFRTLAEEFQKEP
ncbi:MAG: pyridoxal phosphate-dependent decarboxylase family protein [Promethearchaeota archaeon]